VYLGARPRLQRLSRLPAEFVDAFRRVASIGRSVASKGAPSKIRTPLISMSKADIVRFVPGDGAARVHVSSTAAARPLWSMRRDACCGQGVSQAGVPDPPGLVAGPVVSEVRGASGGTESSPDPEEILVSEVFSAIQGEGALVGHRQVFPPPHGATSAAPTATSRGARAPARAVPARAHRRAPGLGRQADPLPPAHVVEAVDRLWRALPHHSVSVTGASR